MKFIGILITLVFSLVSGALHAQAFPTKPVRFMVGFGAGGSSDTLARLVAQKLTESWGQTVIVENRPGAGGTIATDMVAKAAPDGYMLAVGDIGPNAIAGSLYPQLPYDPLKDFTHITRLVTFPLVLVVPAASSLTSMKDLLDQARAKPGALRYSSAGVGTSPHVFLEMINAMAKIQNIPIHYKGGAPAMAGLLSGDVEFTMFSVSTARAQFQAGKVKIIGITSASPIAALPGVPPIGNTVPGFEALTFHGLHGPSKMPRALVDKINQDAIRAMNRPDTKERLDTLAMDNATGTPEEFTEFIRKQIELWTPIVRNANIRGDS